MARRKGPPANRAARTAWGPIVQVALEQYVPRQQRIVQDSLAYHFLPVYLRLLVRAMSPKAIRERLLAAIDRRIPGIRGGILCRKRYIDESLADALTSGLDAVVILGAGMDTRGCRLPHGGDVPVYEVDLPPNIAMKTATLRRVFSEVPAHIRFAPVDLERQDVGPVLQAAGYAPGRAAFFILEGVTQYITEATVRRLLASLQIAGAGSRLVFTYIQRDFMEGREMYDLELLYRQTRIRQSFWHFGLEPESVGAFLEPYGWHEVEQAGSEEYQARYLRPAGRALPVMSVERIVYAAKGYAS